MLKKSLLISLILFLVLSIAWNSPAYAKPNLQVQNDGVVRVFMFWSSTCGHCEYVIKNVLPPLEEQYGDQFEILMVELVTQQDVDRLYETAAIVGITKDQVGVPFMLIGDQVLLGSDQISNELPRLMDFHLAQGGTDYPRLEPLIGYLPEAAAGVNAGNAVLLQDEGEQSSTPTAIAVTEPVDVTTAEPRSNGLTLALVILVGMILALAYVIFALLRDSKPGGSQRISWIDWLIPVVTVLGMGVAGYLTYIENTSVQAICGPIGDCNAVQNSSYARVLGVLPVGILGLLGYAAILIAWIVHRLREDRLGDYARLAMLGMALFGTLYSIYLTYIEIWVIVAVCIWCLSSAVLMTLLMLLSIRPAREALDALGEEEDE
ncbi:MAG: vitamin K epoxide reductase family protein [Anaerolineales bacterium]